MSAERRTEEGADGVFRQLLRARGTQYVLQLQVNGRHLRALLSLPSAATASAPSRRIRAMGARPTPAVERLELHYDGGGLHYRALDLDSPLFVGGLPNALTRVARRLRHLAQFESFEGETAANTRRITVSSHFALSEIGRNRYRL